MQKQVYLSVILGLIFNTLFFAQSGVEIEKEIEVEQSVVNDETLTEITIERIVIDEDGNETKYVIKKIGTDAEKVLSDEVIQNQIHNDFRIDPDGDGAVKAKKIIILEDIDDNFDDRQREAFFIRKNDKTPTPKVRMGVELENVDEGVRVKYVGGNSAAKMGGLQEGDIITLLDNQPVKTHEELTNLLLTKDVGDELLVHFIRGEEELNANLTLKPNAQHRAFQADGGDCGYIEKPCLGVYFNSWNDGIKITGVFDQSGAEIAGLEEGDKILSVNGQVYTFTRQFDRMIKSQEPGTMIEIRYEREGEPATLEAEVGVWDACGVCRLISRDIAAVEEFNQASGELSLESFEMYPVPARDQVTLSFKAEQAPIEVTLYDVNGRMINQQKLDDFSGDFSQTYQLNDAAKGIALFTITQNGKSTTKQAMIQ